MHLYSKADNITACVKFITNFMQGPSTYENELFKVTNGIIYICPLTVKIHLRTVSTSFIVCGEPFCEVLHNSINYFLRYKKTRG